MQPKVLNDVEGAILAGEPSRVERRELRSGELLSAEACHFSSEAAKANHGARLKLQHYRLGGKARPLIRYAPVYPELRYEVTEYGVVYRTVFGSAYQQRHVPDEIPLIHPWIVDPPQRHRDFSGKSPQKPFRPCKLFMGFLMSRKAL